MVETALDITKFGVSILVPSVQEMAKGLPTSVPPRYVREDDGVGAKVLGNGNTLEVPVIDFGKLVLGEDDDGAESELLRLDGACKEWGFQLINHGVSAALIEDAKESIQQMFNLPMEEKSKYWHEPSDMEGFEQAFVLSDEQKLDWSDMYYMITLLRPLRNPKLFPKLPPRIRALKMDMEEMNQQFENGIQMFRVNYYPPYPQPELVHGLTPPSNVGGLTILLQVNEMEGLQVRKDGNLVAINPLPNAFVINIGNILEIITNGIYRSIEHRKLTNPVKERLSIATFYNPNLDGDMGPAPSLIIMETPQLFKRLSVRDFFKGLFSREIVRKSSLYTLRI